jgi:glycosyltransferase involved in cell wall biosynthesis
MKTISFCVTVCNEAFELNRLLDQLVNLIRPEDEIIVQVDDSNSSQDVENVIKSFEDKIKVVRFSLNGDFAKFKNNSKKNATKDYYFCVDADEYLTDVLVLNLGEVLELNPEIDIYAVPRINLVAGLTDEDIKKWGWRVDDQERVNYPDYQTRICKNISSICWVGKVHERLTGPPGTYVMMLPEGFELIHPKDIERQRKQNNFYNTI